LRAHRRLLVVLVAALLATTVVPAARSAVEAETPALSDVDKFLKEHGLPPLPPRLAPEGFVEGKSAVIPESLTETRRDFRNADGTITTELTTEPVRFRTSEGSWANFDLSLTESTPGLFQPKAAPSSAARIVSTLAGPIVTTGEPTSQFAYRHPSATATIAAIDSADPAFLRLPSALGPGRDLRLRATTSGFKEEVVLADRASAIDSYEAVIEMPAGRGARQGEGRVEILDSDGNLEAVLGGGFAWDSAEPPAMTGVKVTLITTVGQAAEVRIEVDPEWMAAPLQFPVTIDPYWAANIGSGCQRVFDRYAYCDTSAYSASPASAYEFDTSIYPGNFSNYGIGRAFMQFPLGDLASSYHQVVSANVYLNVTDAHGWGQNFELRQLTSPTTSWTTWNNQPTYYGYSPNPAFTANLGSHGVDVSQTVQNWLNGMTSYGFALIAQNEGDPGTGRYVSSGESGSPPRLSITYNRAPSVPQRCCPASGSTVSTTTPTLTTYSSYDPDGDPLSYLFQVLSSDGSAGIVQSPWTGSTGWQVPSGSLAGGTTYSWRVFVTDGWTTAVTDSSWRFTTGSAPPPSTTTTTTAPTTTTTAPAPAAPTNLDVFADDAAAEVFWDASPGATRYEISAKNLATGATRKTLVSSPEGYVEGLDNGTEYDIKVVAMDSAGGASQAASAGRVTPERWDWSLYGEWDWWDTEGDPINVANGNFSMGFTDLDFPRVFGLDLTRQYNALDTASGPLGKGWSSSLGAHLEFLPCAEGTRGCGKVAYRGPDGRTVQFRPMAEGGYSRPPEFRGELRKIGEGDYQVRHFDGVTETFDPAQGRLLRRQNWDGQAVTYTYSGTNPYPDRIWGATGSYDVALTYDANRRLTRATSTDGRQVAYSYDAAGNLASVTDAAGGVWSLSWAGGLLTQMADPDGHLVFVNTFGPTGRVASQTTAAGTLDFAYSDSRTVVTRPGTGAVSTYVLDGSQRTTSFTNAVGQTWAKAWDPRGNLVSETDPEANLTRWVYDAHDNVTTTTEPGGAVRSAVFDSADRLMSETDELGTVTNYAYEGLEREPSVITTPLGSTTRDIVGGLEVSNTDPDGVTTAYAYDARRNLVKVTDEAGAVVDLGYDAAGNLVRQPMAAGPVVERAFDPLRRVLWQTDGAAARSVSSYSPAGKILEEAEGPATGDVTRRTTYTYDSWGRPLTTTDPLGNVTRTTHDSEGRATRVEAPGGSLTTTTYNLLNQVLTEEDPTGTQMKTQSASGLVSRSTFDTDARGNEVAVTDPIGRVTRSTYDKANRLTSRTEPTGAKTTYTYDAAGREVSRTDPRGHVWRQSWTPGGRQATTTDPTGAVVRHNYDSVGRLASLTRPASGTTTYVYDASGRLVRETSPGANVTTHAYDGAGREIDTTDPGTGRTTRTYHPTGELASVTDATGGVRRFTYDAAGRMATATDALGGVTGFVYDPRGNMTSRTNARGHATTFTYDLADRQLTRAEPGPINLSWEYDALGRQSTRTDTVGRRTRVTYDAAGQRTRLTHADGVVTDLTYDPAGRQVGATGNLGTTTRTYDPAGNLISERQASGRTLRFSWDPAGRRSALTYPDGTEARFTYDADGRLASARYGTDPATTYAYNGDGQPTSENTAGKVDRSWSYRSGRPECHSERFYRPETANLTDEYRAQCAAYDAAGRITHESRYRSTEDSKGWPTTAYFYDKAGQLIGWTDPERGHTSNAYDALGNRLSESTGERRKVSVFDAANRLTRTEHLSGANATHTENFEYWADKLARVTTTDPAALVNDTRYAWDARDRLASINGFGSNGTHYVSANRSYDHDGRLIRMVTYQGGGTGLPPVKSGSPPLGAEVPSALTDGARDTWLSWDPTTPEVPQLADWSIDGEISNFLHGHERIAVASSGSTRYFSRDLHGSPMTTLDTEPWAQGTAYDPWGVPTIAAELEVNRDALVGIPQSSEHLPLLGYRGELTASNLLHLRARDYSAVTGRFTGRDPIDGPPGEVPGTNSYVYSLNSPVVREDPTGLASAFSHFIGVNRRNGRGIVWMAWWIPPAEVGFPGFRLGGDSRGPSSDAHRSMMGSRAFLWLDFDQGNGFVRVNYTCLLGKGRLCVDARGVDDFSLRSFTFHADKNRFSLEQYRSGRGPLVRHSFINSIHAALPGSGHLSPRIDGRVKLNFGSNGYIRAVPAGDTYPAFEAYQRFRGHTRLIGFRPESHHMCLVYPWC
jgi:RHS repeat-associated protein